MEYFSQAFLQASKQALDLPNIVIGTITLGGKAFIQNVKNRDEADYLKFDPKDSSRKRLNLHCLYIIQLPLYLLLTFL